MEIHQFEQFQAIAECGTMREAAEKLYLAQPTLSYNLKKLESELGCKLFVRKRNRLELTPYGNVVLERVRAISDDFKEMISVVEEMKQREEAVLHIGCFSPILSAFLMPHVAADLAESAFDVVNCPTADLIAGLEEGRFDLLMASDICRKRSLKWRKIYEERAYISIPKGTFEGSEANSADLMGMEFTIESGLAGYSDWYAHILREAGVSGESIEHVPHREHLLTKDALPTTNLITSFIMGFARVSEARDIIPISEPFARRNVGFLYHDGAPEKVTTFVNHVLGGVDRFLSGNAFIPFFVYPDNSGNLAISNE